VPKTVNELIGTFEIIWIVSEVYPRLMCHHSERLFGEEIPGMMYRDMIVSLICAAWSSVNFLLWTPWIRVFQGRHLGSLSHFCFHRYMVVVGTLPPSWRRHATRLSVQGKISRQSPRAALGIWHSRMDLTGEERPRSSVWFRKIEQFYQMGRVLVAGGSRIAERYLALLGSLLNR
jgi:hypothetical protein